MLILSPHNSGFGIFDMEWVVHNDVCLKIIIIILSHNWHSHLAKN